MIRRRGRVESARMAPPRIFVSVGDVSGDLHGANLVRTLRRMAPGSEIAGLGGPRMARAGARLLADTSWFGIIGVWPLFGTAGRYAELLSRADRFLARWRPDVAVTIDCPGFHFLLGSRLRTRRIPTLWYIPPQLWAWGSGRVRKLRRRFTRVACVLPHEEAFFRSHGVPVTFVGHPTIDHLRELDLDEAFIRSLRAKPGETLVALLPGSRVQEVARVLRREVGVARAIAARRPQCRFVVSLAEESHRAWADPVLASAADLPIRAVVGKTHEVQQAADLALVASGTATLELTYYATPMVIFYGITWAQWHLLGRWLVRTPHLSLPNALAGRRIVEEFMWDRPVSDAECRTALELLENPAVRRKQQEELRAIREQLDKPGSVENVAREVLDLAGTAVPPPPSLRPGFAM